MFTSNFLPSLLHSFLSENQGPSKIEWGRKEKVLIMAESLQVPGTMPSSQGSLSPQDNPMSQGFRYPIVQMGKVSPRAY